MMIPKSYIVRMVRLHRTDSSDPDFRALTQMLDAELAIMDGDEHAFYSQFNKIDNIRYALVAYVDDQPAGCGAIKHFSDGNAEVKRMYVQTSHRRAGIASTILQELETWARELDYNYCILETGKQQPEAIGLYTRMGYAAIPNYGQYAFVENSVCFRKDIRA